MDPESLSCYSKASAPHPFLGGWVFAIITYRHWNCTAAGLSIVQHSYLACMRHPCLTVAISTLLLSLSAAIQYFVPLEHTNRAGSHASCKPKQGDVQGRPRASSHASCKPKQGDVRPSHGARSDASNPCTMADQDHFRSCKNLLLLDLMSHKINKQEVKQPNQPTYNTKR